MSSMQGRLEVKIDGFNGRCLCNSCIYGHIRHVLDETDVHFCTNPESTWYLQTTGCMCKLYEPRRKKVRRVKNGST